MLKQRILTALVLLPLMLLMLFFAPNWLWASFSGLITLLVLWEYSRLVKLGSGVQMPYLVACALFMFLAYLGAWQLPHLAWWGVLLFWLIGMPLWLKNRWRLEASWQALACGCLIMLPFWFALISLRPNTANALSLLAIMTLVWIADIAAYVFGKLWGKRKLAPSISPGKSWEGALGGTLAAVVYMLLAYQADWFDFSTGSFSLILIAILLTSVSIGGDLLESWLKRSAGVKDSSQLLPGHGGIFDRTDSLIAVLSLYAAFMAIFQ